MLDGYKPARPRLSPELVALCERPEPKQGPEPDLIYFTDEDYQAAAAELLKDAGDGPVLGLRIWFTLLASSPGRRSHTPCACQRLAARFLHGD